MLSVAWHYPLVSLSCSFQVTAQIGHSRQTARTYYLREDDRHAVEAAEKMIGILEEEGERLWEETPKSLWDPVSDFVREKPAISNLLFMQSSIHAISYLLFIISLISSQSIWDDPVYEEDDDECLLEPEASCHNETVPVKAAVESIQVTY